MINPGDHFENENFVNLPRNDVHGRAEQLAEYGETAAVKGMVGYSNDASQRKFFARVSAARISGAVV